MCRNTLIGGSQPPRSVTRVPCASRGSDRPLGTNTLLPDRPRTIPVCNGACAALPVAFYPQTRQEAPKQALGKGPRVPSANLCDVCIQPLRMPTPIPCACLHPSRAHVSTHPVRMPPPIPCACLHPSRAHACTHTMRMPASIPCACLHPSPAHVSTHPMCMPTPIPCACLHPYRAHVCTQPLRH